MYRKSSFVSMIEATELQIVTRREYCNNLMPLNILDVNCLMKKKKI
jgi:hypothetical protein